MYHRTPKRMKLGALVIATMLLTSTMSFFNIDGMLYRASILSYPEHEPFDGTVYPVKKTPNWVKLSSAEYDNDYTDLSSSDLIDLPYYNPNELKTSTENLVWGDAEDDAIRNAKITYSVPYMGNYKFDGKEYGGSHPAIDIKIPEGTPIYSIANGTVTKATEQSSGFGNHIVVMHNNFPSLENSSKKETIYASYSHMSKLYVDSGDVVEKGEKIGLSGDSGTATTPHLHFQMDNDEAPWSPYWPFTWAEAQDAGLDFFGAVNAGLGQSNAEKVTINAMKYVQTYMDDSNYDEDDFEVEEEEEEEEEEVEEEETVTSSYVSETNEEEEEEETVEEEEEEKETIVFKAKSELDFIIEVSDTYNLDFNGSYSFSLRDQYGDNAKKLFNGYMTLVSDQGRFLPKSTILSFKSFDKDGNYTANFKKLKKAGKDRLKLSYNGDVYYSDWFEILDDEFRFTDVPDSHKYASSIYGLAEKKVVNGYSDGSFGVNNLVSRVEGIKLVLEAVDSNIYKGDSPFNDIMKDAWYLNYLYTAYKKGIIDGDPDGNFRPNYSVQLVEFLKIVFNGMGVNIDENVTVAPYDDVDANEWYAPYVAYAKELEIIDPNVSKIYPAKEMTRGEVAEIIYKVMLLND